MKMYLTDSKYKKIKMPFLFMAFAAGEELSLNEERLLNRALRKADAGRDFHHLPISPVCFCVGGGDCEHGSILHRLFRAVTNFSFKIAYNMKVKRPRLDGRVFQSWKAFIQDGRGTSVKAVKKDCHEMAIISHTGGTTGEPKGCMISDYNTNAEIWQVGMTMYPARQECMMAVLPPFVNYSLTNGMFEPLAFGMLYPALSEYCS